MCKPGSEMQQGRGDDNAAIIPPRKIRLPQQLLRHPSAKVDEMQHGASIMPNHRLRQVCQSTLL